MGGLTALLLVTAGAAPLKLASVGFSQVGLSDAQATLVSVYAICIPNGTVCSSDQQCCNPTSGAYSGSPPTCH